MSEGLKNAVASTENLESIPLAIAKVIREDAQLDREQKKEAFALIREWVQYVKEFDVQIDDPYILRSHLEKFAARFSSETPELAFESIQSVTVDSIQTPDGTEVTSMIKDVVDPKILNDRRVVVYGGVARTLLRAYTQQESPSGHSFLQAELPISDIDMMIVGSDDAAAIAHTYGSELGGTKIIADVDQELMRYFGTVDMTMNQAAVHEGTLFYTKEAYEDAAAGTLRMVGAEKPLFGRDAIRLQNDEVYLFGGAFYRALSMLLRGRGREIVISQENIDAEASEIGVYWLVILFVKILHVSDKVRRDEAILQWYQVAKDIGSTATNSPAEFLVELFEQTPNYSVGGVNGDFDLEAQTRWLVGKLVKRGTDSVTEKDQHFIPPKTYTPANITLRPYEGDRDLTEFWKVVEAHQNKTEK